MKKSIVLLAILLFPILVSAHGDWLEVKGSGKVGEPTKIQLVFGAYENQERVKGAKIAFLKDFTVYVMDAKGIKTTLEMTQTETCFEGTFTPTSEGLFQIIGINEVREVVDWTVHGFDVLRPTEYLRTQYVVEKSTENASEQGFLDVIPTKMNEDIKLTAFKNKGINPKAKLTITNPEGWEKIKFTDAKGEAIFKPNMKGMYMVEMEYLDKTAGNFKGKDYKMVRNKFSLMVMVE